MSACTHDGEGVILPLAIALAEIENLKNWVFFLYNLHLAIPNINRLEIVLMHDREKGIPGAKAEIFPDLHDSNCVFHIEKKK